MKEQTKDPQNKKKLQKTENEFCVVGVGASAGGLDAFNRFVKAIPGDSGMAYVLVQHLDAEHQSQLAEILQRVTKIPVREIKDDMKVEPNTIYVIPSNKIVIANDGVLELKPRQSKEVHSRFLPIDLFLDSLARVYSSYSVGVILSGTGSDGTQGLTTIKDHGGVTFAQDEESAAYNGMPKSAVDAGVVDFVLAPEKMPKKILEVTGTMENKIGKKDREEEEKEGEIGDKKKESLETEGSNVLNNIFSLLRNRKGTDFTYYKKTTVRRRVLRRMAINEKEDPVDYLQYLKENPKEQDVLYQDLLIPVTNFFRDIHIIENLCNTVFPNILKNRDKDKPIRIWTAGCSTGEEAYTIAICLLEYLENPSRELPLGELPKVQIFGTDISEPAIAKARAEIYKKNEVEGLSSKRLENYFTKIDGSYQIDKKVREMCVFALHNFLKDPPFGRMDFISCRNVLIYMEPYLQKKALTTFHYALKPKGDLLLGKSETISSVPDLFAVEDKKDKLFSRKNKSGKFMPLTSRRTEESLKDKNEEPKAEPKLTNFQKAADDIILNKYTPSGVVVNEAMDIVQFKGNTGKYLEQASGKPTHNLLKLAKMGLAFELRNIVHKAGKISLSPNNNGDPKAEILHPNGENSVIKKDIPIEVNGHQRYISIEAIPLPKLVEIHYLILFHDQEFETAGNKPLVQPRNEEKDLRIKQLEQELSQSREDMRSITEDQEAANEEMQSANEELQSSSEELQSLNEELETSKEELESTNEELVSVNHEQVSLNQRLRVSRDFAEDVLATIQEPLLVLDKNFMVKSANKSFYKKFRVKEGETEDKSVFELGNHQWEIPGLRELLETILPKKSSFEGFEISHDFPHLGHRTMVVNAREIKREEGGEKLLLLVFGDITDKRLTEKNLEKSEIKFRVMVETIPQLIWITNPTGKAEFFNPQWEHYTGATSKESVKNRKWMSFLHPDDATDFQKKWFLSLETGDPFIHQYRLKSANGKYCWFLAKSVPFYDTNGEILKWFGSFTNIETQKQAEKALQKSEEHFRQLTDLMPDKVSNADASGHVYYYNQSWLNFTGLSLKESIKQGWVQFIHPDEKKEVMEKWKSCIESGEDFEMEMRVKNKKKRIQMAFNKDNPCKR